jgi:Tfp pilus assembly protein PilO
MPIIFSASRLMKAKEVRAFCQEWMGEEDLLKQQDNKAKTVYESYKTKKEKAASADTLTAAV